MLGIGDDPSAPFLPQVASVASVPATIPTFALGEGKIETNPKLRTPIPNDRRCQFPQHSNRYCGNAGGRGRARGRGAGFAPFRFPGGKWPGLLTPCSAAVRARTGACLDGNGGREGGV